MGIGRVKDSGGASFCSGDKVNRLTTRKSHVSQICTPTYTRRVRIDSLICVSPRRAMDRVDISNVYIKAEISVSASTTGSPISLCIDVNNPRKEIRNEA